FAIAAAGNDGKAGLHGTPFVFGIDFEVAEEFFGYDFFVFPIERLQVRAGAEANLRHFTRQLGRIAFAAGNGAGYGVDHDILRARIIFGGVGVGDAENVAGKLDQSVLKTSASAEKGPVAATGKLNPFQHAVETLVGTAGRRPETVKAFENFFCVIGG